MAWIESHTVLIRHRKLLILAQRLRIPPAHALGILHSLWHAALEQQEDGDLSSWSDDLIADLACAPKIGTSQFVDHLRQSGWLDGHLLHDWLDYAGRYLETKYRSKQPQKLAAIWAKRGKRWDGPGSGTDQGQTQDGPRTDPGPPTQPDLTQPNLTNQTPTSPPAPAIPWAAWFDEVWGQYPVKDGKKAAERHFRATVKTLEDFEAIKKALQNYLASDKVKKGFIKNGSTWFNNWRDWVGYTETARPEPPKPGEEGYVLTNLDKIIAAFRDAKGIPKTDRQWRLLMWERQKTEAQVLLDYFCGDWQAAATCIGVTAEKCRGMEWGWRAVMTRAAEFKNQGTTA